MPLTTDSARLEANEHYKQTSYRKTNLLEGIFLALCLYVSSFLSIQACVAALREVLGPLVPEEAILQVGLLALNPEHPYLSQSFLGYCGILDVSLS